MLSKKDISGPQGSSPDLMPSIMGAFDAYLQNTDQFDSEAHIRTSTPKRTHQVGNFANLSPCVQKILSNVPEQEISKKFSSEETLGFRRNRLGYRSLRDKAVNKSNESLDIVSPSVHKMLSNLQDSELVISTHNLSITTRTVNRNQSYLFSRAASQRSKQHYNLVTSDCNNLLNSSSDSQTGSYSQLSDSVSDRLNGGNDESDASDFVPKPLGSYLHSDKGIASRTPVGRKNMGKYLQIPSESSTGGMTNSTASSSEVSRPVSLTSLGSCSSSGSSNGPSSLHNQPGSAYLASAESLDSDPEPAGSQGSADSGIAEQEQPSINPEQRVLQEVLDTETVYVADLQEVIQGYLEPWRSEPNCPLTAYLTDLFANLEAIHEFNRKILEDLRAAKLNPSKTANVFLQHDGGFKVYNTYCARYPRTMEVLGDLQRNEKMAPLIREKQILLGHALPLGSYLLKPVQRILKYHLLLQRLSKQCEPQHKPTVDLALATMTSVASDINNMKRKHEHAVRVQEIQSQLYGWTGKDLTTLGELIAEGTFRVQGAKGRRHVFLFEKVLLLAKSKTEGALAYKTHIECSNLMLVEQVRGDPLSFQVLPFDNPRLHCTLRARSPHHKREWTLQIKRVILENYSAVIPSHARQLVMQLGQDATETVDDSSEKWSPMKHNSTTPHYLERRKETRSRKGGIVSKERSASQDRTTFTSFGSWRRKSEPSMIPQQFDGKVVTKRMTKLKKGKEVNGCSTFYTDLSSDYENCDLTAESVESLPTRTEEGEIGCPEEVESPINSITIESNLEKIVSELLMQKQDFHKMFNRAPSQNQQRHPRRNVTSEPGPIWYHTEDVSHHQLPNKADSLPRSFQLKDPTFVHHHQTVEEKHEHQSGGDFGDPPQNSDLSSRLDDTDHPEYKIYRQTPIRLSLLQRFRNILSEEQRRNYGKHQQQINQKGNKSTGEKLAHPDYVDPQTLFGNSRNNSQVNLNQDIMGERVELDMSLNEKEVLKEIEQRLKEKSSTSSPSDSYYESILENSLTEEEYVRDERTGKLVAKSDSFTHNDHFNRKVMKRPTKAPPPIPAKPLKLLTPKQGTNEMNTTLERNSNITKNSSWVKAMVDRFE